MEYPKDLKFAQYFFREHSFDELEEWTLSMQFFRYLRAIGGHANDFDTLVCALRIEGEADLVDLCTKLGFSLLERPAVPSRSENALQPSPPRSPIAAFPRFESPGSVEIAGVQVFPYVRYDRLEIHLWGVDPYSIDVRAVENARRVEQVLMPFLSRLIDPPTESDRCFTR